jgi:hypothetical protein
VVSDNERGEGAKSEQESKRVVLQVVKLKIGNKNI